MINFVASSTLIIYLVHDHPFVRSKLWTDIAHVASFSHSPWLIPYSFGIVFAVFAVGVALTGLYRYSVGLLIAKGLNWAEKKVLYRIDNALSFQGTDAPENDCESNRESRVTSEKENRG